MNKQEIDLVIGAPSSEVWPFELQKLLRMAEPLIKGKNNPES